MSNLSASCRETLVKVLCLDTGEAHKAGTTRKSCRHCKKIYARKRRTEYRAPTRVLPRNQYLAKRAIFYAVRSKAIKKASEHLCVDCGQSATVYDHRDYLKPLEVVPVCHLCNCRRGPAKNLL